MKSKSEIAATMLPFRFTIENLAGNHNSTNRQLLMQDITGERRPKAICGINALQKEMESRFPHVHLAPCRARYRNALKAVLTDTPYES